MGGIVSPFAWAIGSRAVKQIDASGGHLGGRSQAQAGKILGIVGTVILIFWISIFAIVIIAAVATSGISTS
ncbi:MAG TPA: hypothetical protein VFQ15_02370 [Jiangellaceae bacterium]|nr:hypothetical protein [Jiangellaceae bacterium]